MDLVLQANPQCAILLTVPNDCYYKKDIPIKIRKDNEKSLLSLQRNTDVVYGTSMVLWEGLGSSNTWRMEGL